MDKQNYLYFGDNLDWLQNRSEFPDESVDLVYLDPPFNSKANYNKIFNEPGGVASQAQIRAFDDTWDWEGPSSGDALAMMAKASASDAVLFIEWLARRGGATSKGMAAYLAMMGIRLLELHRVLKPTGSIYLHCDPTASHHLKILMDCIFGSEQFRNEIIWRRTGAHGPRRSFGSIHDTLLFYTKTSQYYFNVVRKPYMRGHVEGRYATDATGRQKFVSGGNVLTGAGATRGESGAPWKGFDPSAKNRHWAIPGFLAEQMPPEFANLGVLARLDALYEAGLIDIIPGAAWPTPVRYLRPQDGQPLQSIWAYQPYTEDTVYGTEEGIDSDVAWLGPTDPERTGYQTQKPVGLLERIILSSCPESGLVLDPFCGCGTAVIAAQKLNRQWKGIDITYLAIDLIEERLKKNFPSSYRGTYRVLGSPRDEASARNLMERRPKQFEIWAIHLVGAHAREHDGGVDGLYTLVEGVGKRKVSKVVVQVKGGKHLNPGMVRDLMGTVKNEGAALGLLITLEEATPGMRELASHSGFYRSPVSDQEYPIIQIRTVKQLLEGQGFDLPPGRIPT